MFFSPRLTPFLLFLVSSPTISFSSLRWVSAKIPQTSPQLTHLLFNARMDLKRYDYELALVSALKSCATHLDVSQGRQLHCFVLKSGNDSNIFVQNSLINMYAKCGFISDAQNVFDSCSRLDTASYNIMIGGYARSGRLDDARWLFEIMPDRGCVSYTTMIIGLVLNDCWTEAIEVFKNMRIMGVVPNEVTMVNVISASTHLGGIWDCRMLHGLVTKLQLEGLVLISTNLLHMYCICSSLGDARRLFDEMPDRNIVSWNVMLNGYSKAGLVDFARELFETIPNKDVVSWGTMIDAYCQIEWLSEAMMMYRALLQSGLRPNEIMIVDLVSACSKATTIREGLQFHCVIVQVGFECSGFLQATIIHFYASCGRIKDSYLQFEVGIKNHVASSNALIAGFIRNGMTDEARKMFNEMPERDVFAWSSMIAGYAQSEQPYLALELFHEMVASGVQPNEITMVSVFSAISSLGTLKEGRWAHQYVHNNSIPLTDNLSAAIIDMYAKCGSINTALELFYQIREKAGTVSPWNAVIFGLAMHGHANLSLDIFSDLLQRSMKLNAITFIGVLTACCHAGLVNLGERYFRSMKSEHNIDPDIKHYGCMVDLLGRAGRLQEAEEMIESMPMKADVVIWGTLLAASRTHRNVDVGERAAENLARLEPSHGASRVLLSNIYADAGRWDDAHLVRNNMQSHRLKRLPGFSGVV